MNAHEIISRLKMVRPRGDGQWSARCPAHEDRGPSLSIKELTDGRVLMHCFAGCTVDRVTGAIGMGLEDLFPPVPAIGAGQPPAKRRALLSKGQALDLLSAEALFVAVAAANVAKGIALADSDMQRLMKSSGRIALLQLEAAS